MRVECRNVTKSFGQTLALESIALDIARGECVTLVGASGCGKSTLLRTIAGLERADSGQVLVDGRPIVGPGTDRAMVFQQQSLYPWLSVRQNILFSRQLSAHLRGRTDADVEAATQRVEALLQSMGLKAVSRNYPNQLSGGMQQRVAIARALMSRPDILLMDEPFGALDAQTREVMHDLLLHVHRIEGATIVLVTHDVEEAIYLGHRVVLMAPRPGRIAQVYEVPLPARRHRDMRSSAPFLRLKSDILARIRETSGIETDLALLDALASDPATTAQADA